MQDSKAAARTCAVDDLQAFLTGAWSIARAICDRRAGVRGRFDGTARFTPVAEGLDCRESGWLVIGSHAGPADQRHRYLFPTPDRAEIRFRDGAFFHTLDLTSGAARAVHACPPDLYRARFRVLAPDAWCVVWRVRGPRKDLTLASRFTRLSPRAA